MSTAPIPHAPEIALLKLAAAGDRQPLAARLLSRQVDPVALADFLQAQQLGVYFAAMLGAMRLQKLLPASVRQRFDWQREAQRHRRQHLAGALQHLQPAFAGAGIPVILTKGLHLAAAYWGGVENRFTWDLDLLVPQRHLDGAIAVLQREGYRSAHRRTLAPLLARRVSHAMEFTRGDVAVDLHWLFRPRPGHTVDYGAIFDRSGRWAFEGQEYRVLHPEDTLLMLLLGIAEDAERSQLNYRKLWDIYLMLRAGAVADWDRFFNGAQRQGVGRLAAAMLALTGHALDCAAEFPDLQQALAPRIRDLPCSARELQAVIARRPLHPANRLWSARLQPVPAALYLAWWTLTAPIRYLVWR